MKGKADLVSDLQSATIKSGFKVVCNDPKKRFIVQNTLNMRYTSHVSMDAHLGHQNVVSSYRQLAKKESTSNM